MLRLVQICLMIGESKWCKRRMDRGHDGPKMNSSFAFMKILITVFLPVVINISMSRYFSS